MDVGSWLRNLGLGQEETAFVANAIDSDVLTELTEVDFQNMGIPLGDRKRLIKAIKAIGAIDKTGVGGDSQNAHSAERRHLTVMICDLVGSTALTARVGPVGMGALIDCSHLPRA